MLKFCLVIDTERLISFKQGNPRWNLFNKLKGKINNFLKKYRYNYYGFEKVYELILRERFPSTFMLVGSLFEPKKSPSFVEWGYHTYNHIPLTLVDDERIRKEVKNIYKSKSMCPPLWMVEDVRDPDRVFRIIKSEGYKNVIYRGKDMGLKHEHHFEISKPKKRLSLNLVHVSNCFEGNSNEKHVKNILKEIEDNLDKEAIYCLSTHDFSHRNVNNLIRIIRRVRDLENKKKLKILRIQDVK